MARSKTTDRYFYRTWVVEGKSILCRESYCLGVLSVFVCVGGFRCSTRLEFQVGIRKVCVTCVSSPLEEFWKNLKLLKHGHGDGDGDGDGDGRE